MELHVQVPVSRWIMFNNTIQGHTKYVLQHSLVSHQNGWRPHDWWPDEQAERRRERRGALRWNMRRKKATQRLNVARGFFPLSLFEIDQNYARHICRFIRSRKRIMKHETFTKLDTIRMQRTCEIVWIFRNCWNAAIATHYLCLFVEKECAVAAHSHRCQFATICMIYSSTMENEECRIETKNRSHRLDRRVMCVCLCGASSLWRMETTTCKIIIMIVLRALTEHETIHERVEHVVICFTIVLVRFLCFFCYILLLRCAIARALSVAISLFRWLRCANEFRWNVVHVHIDCLSSVASTVHRVAVYLANDRRQNGLHGEKRKSERRNDSKWQTRQNSNRKIELKLF